MVKVRSLGVELTNVLDDGAGPVNKPPPVLLPSAERDCVALRLRKVDGVKLASADTDCVEVRLTNVPVDSAPSARSAHVARR